MHHSNALYLGILAAASAAPHNQPRNETWTCTISGMWANSATIQYAPDASEEGAEGAASGELDGSTNQYMLLTANSSTGATRNLWASADKDPILESGVTLSAMQSGLSDSVSWAPGGGIVAPLGSCICGYGDNPKITSTDVDESITSWFVSTFSSDQCNCHFDCVPNLAGYSTGWCGVHVTQHQKPDPATDNYTYDVRLYDAAGLMIGNGTGLNIPTDQTGSIDSQLPAAFEVISGAVDDDAIWFHYDGQAFTSNDQAHHCNFGAYDGGKREGDCGFECGTAL